MTTVNSTNTNFLQVALPVPLNSCFDYKISEQQLNKVQVGCRVLVPFGRKSVIGIAIGVVNKTSVELNKVKAVIEVLDDAQVLSPTQMKLAEWLASFYIYPLGEVISTMLPKLLRTSTHLPNSLLSEVLELSQTVSQNDIETQLARSKKQLSLYQELQMRDAPIELSEVRQTFSQAVVKALIEKGIAATSTIETAAKPWHLKLEIAEHKRASTEQAIAITAVNQAQGFAPFLLEGITGSGKTEVYLQVIEQVLSNKQQVLVLVPEIGLTPQTVARFEQRFGSVVGVWHSGLTDNQRLQLWQQAQSNQVGIVIGTRSSIFLPMPALGMIIVDEEHDDSFKQQDGLRYHARDVAAYRAQQAKVRLVLGSATPSLETLHNALHGKYRHLQLLQRAGNARLPTTHLLDTNGQQLTAGIAPAMIGRIKHQLEQGNQVLVFVNRRGFAPALLCTSCGNVETCSECDTPYTVHLHDRSLQCHRCAKVKRYPNECSECGSEQINTRGVGTEQVQQALGSLFPEHSCVRIDSDSIRGKKLHTLLKQIRQNQHQILVGTQILSKGHHFENVTLALILNVDGFLFSSDFRAPEKLGQLVTQISGRAGRADKPGEVWLQSSQVGNPLLQDLINNGYAHFARTILEERRHANLPPTVWQIAIRAEHKDQARAIEFMQFANRLLSQFANLQISGPFPAGIEKKQDRYRFVCIAQSSSLGYLTKALTQAKKALSDYHLASTVRWSVDVLPSDFC